jgi:galactokinase
VPGTEAAGALPIVARAPGRVNLLGDHTDYSGGLVCPMAIDLATVVRLEARCDSVQLTSGADPEPARVPLDVTDPAALRPAWARYVAGVVAVLRPLVGGCGSVESTLPVGAGLSSSAALEVAVALALGADDGDRAALASACQRAEQWATGVPCGPMDQLIVACAVAGHALLIDCTSMARTPVPIPAGVEVVVVDSGQPRRLDRSAYAARRAEVEAAAAALGVGLRHAGPSDAGHLADRRLRRRARHVVSENRRVIAFAAALEAGDLAAAGAAMTESHASLRDDFEVSTPALNALVGRLAETPGVFGARLTGAGFGGCVVALTEPGATARLDLPRRWVVTAAGPAERAPAHGGDGR